jgi:hypothetical protein
VSVMGTLAGPLGQLDREDWGVCLVAS